MSGSTKARRRNNDIKAPDGFLLGGLRKVRADGTILFQRSYWQAPKEWAGERVWVHEEWVNTPKFPRGELVLEAAPPSVHIYSARLQQCTVICERTQKPDAKPGYRKASHKAWAARCAKPSEIETCKACSGETHPDEAACIHCGTTKTGWVWK